MDYSHNAVYSTEIQENLKSHQQTLAKLQYVHSKELNIENKVNPIYRQQQFFITKGKLKEMYDTML